MIRNFIVSTLQLINSYIAGCHTVLSALWQLRMQDFLSRISLHKKKKKKIIIMIIIITTTTTTTTIIIIIIKETPNAVPKAAKLWAVFHFNTSILMSFQDLFLLKCVDSKTFPKKSKNFEAHRRALTHAQI